MEIGNKRDNNYPDYNQSLLITGVLAMVGGMPISSLFVLFWMIFVAA